MKFRNSIFYLLGASITAASIIVAVRLNKRLKNLPAATSRKELLNVPLDPVTMEQALTRINEFICAGGPHHVFTADASGIMAANEDAEMLAIVRRAALVTADGAGALLAARLHGYAFPERVSGVDLLERTCELAASESYAVYLLGAGEGVADSAAEKLTSRYTTLKIAGTHNGFFLPAEEEQLVADIAATEPRILFVALGIPKQEKFINRHFAQFGNCVMIGVGGSFDVISGQLHRAPRWMQRAGLEWLYRLAQQPSRLPRLFALPRFIIEAWRSARKNA